MTYTKPRPPGIFSTLLLLLLVSGCSDDDQRPATGGAEDDGMLFVASNLTGRIGMVNIDRDSLRPWTFATTGTDTEGLYYRSSDGTLFVVDRSTSTLVQYEGVMEAFEEGAGVSAAQSSSSDFVNGRGLAYNGGTFVVAQAGSGNGTLPSRFVAYTEQDGRLQRDRTLDTDIDLYGIHFVGSTLYAVLSNGNRVAVFYDLMATADGDTIRPDRTIEITGALRLHGIEYDPEGDILLLSDLGAPGRDDDGSIIAIKNFAEQSDRTEFTDEQFTRIAGDRTRLGNPVDIEYDPDSRLIYVADRSSEGGLLLAFQSGLLGSGNTPPTRVLPVSGISSVFLHRD